MFFCSYIESQFSPKLFDDQHFSNFCVPHKGEHTFNLLWTWNIPLNSVQNNCLLSSNGLIVLHVLQTARPLHCKGSTTHTLLSTVIFTVVPFTTSVVKATFAPLHHRPVLLHTPLSSNACPALTGFVLPTGPWCSTRPGKSYYTGVTALDFPIRDSKRRIRVYYNTGFAAFPPKVPPHSLVFMFSFLSISCVSSVFFSFFSVLFSWWAVWARNDNK